jgi:hypothetical protein
MLVLNMIEVTSEMITRHDLLEEYKHINEIYNGHMDLILWMFGIGITVVGVLLPVFIYYFQNKRFDIEIEQLKKDLKLEIEYETKKAIKQKTKNLKVEMQKEIDNAKAKSIAMSDFSSAVALGSSGDYIKSAWYFISASRFAINDNNYILLNSITSNLKLILDKKVKFKTSNFTVFEDIRYNEFIDEINNSAMIKSSGKIYVEQYLEVFLQFVE